MHRVQQEADQHRQRHVCCRVMQGQGRARVMGPGAGGRGGCVGAIGQR